MALLGQHRLRVLFCVLLALPWTVRAQPGPGGVKEEVMVPALSLPQLAANADLIALVQVADTDYQYTRGFPSGGSAFLNVLIPYKVTRPLPDLVEVYEEGLHEHECYFPGPEVGASGRRFLVFLRFSDTVKSQYNGLAQGCALEVLVTRENRYALRYPLEGLALSETYEDHVRAMPFADANALVAEDDISPDRRNRLLAAGWLIRESAGADRPGIAPAPPTAPETRYRFTSGIDLGTARQLMGPEALTLDRSLK